MTTLRLCLRVLPSRSTFKEIQPRLCQKLEGHLDAHHEFPYLDGFYHLYPSVAKKIIRDATMTTGAAWKSPEAGPNRALRWIMLLPDEELRHFGIHMNKL